MKYQQIGNILIFNKIKRKEAKEILKKSNIKTICVRKGKIYGQFKKPRLKVIMSRVKKDKTITIHKEFGILYKIDVAKLMFSKGNINERHRIAKIAKKNEVVVDMFAGIGYFSLPLAKKVKKVYAIEINPVSFHYLLENIKLNKIKNIIPINDDCSQAVKRLKKADRVIMGFLPSPQKYLGAAFKISKKGTVIHYHYLIERNDKQALNVFVRKINMIKKAKKIKILRAIRVKSFSPRFEHYVLDLKVF